MADDVHREAVMPAQMMATRGFASLPSALSAAAVAEIADRCGVQGAGRAGDRQVLGEPWCRDLAAQLRRTLVAHGLMPVDHLAILCTLFEKSAHRNWQVGLHQDLSVPVQGTCVDASWPGHSVKGGSTFVHAPDALLGELVAVRLHLDPCGEDDGPLGVVPGSHAFGRLGTQEAARLRERLGLVRCLASAGDLLVMRPALLHASSKSQGKSRRRVLHFVYAPGRPPLGLAWADGV